MDFRYSAISSAFAMSFIRVTPFWDSGKECGVSSPSIFLIKFQTMEEDELKSSSVQNCLKDFLFWLIIIFFAFASSLLNSSLKWVSGLFLQVWNAFLFLATALEHSSLHHGLGAL